MYMVRLGKLAEGIIISTLDLFFYTIFFFKQYWVSNLSPLEYSVDPGQQKMLLSLIPRKCKFKLCQPIGVFESFSDKWSQVHIV